MGHAGLHAEVLEVGGRLGAVGAEHQGHVSRHAVEVHQVVLPAVGCAEGHGVNGHERREVGDVGHVARHQTCRRDAGRCVGPEGQGACRRASVGVGQYGHRGLPLACYEEQRTAAREVALVAHYGVGAHLRQASPPLGVGARRQAVEVLAVRHRERWAQGGELQGDVAARCRVAAVEGAYMHGIA